MPTFDHIILNGRPGGGKSELIDFFKKLPLAERRDRYHLGEFIELDDFVWLWDKFVEDDCWQAIGEARRYSRRVPGGYVQLEGDKLLDMLMTKFNVMVKRHGDSAGFYDDNTIFVEFARGIADGGFGHAYELLSDYVLERAAVLYIKVSFAESQRKNEARYQAQLAHSILAHRVPEEAIDRFSRDNDWETLTGGRPDGYLEVRGHRVPFVAMDNEPELHDQAALAARYGAAMRRLWALYEAR
ncbi:MAG: hypothetical protein CSA66_05365 [Proteobacteria bacterium]|nr:MAG: hypothetical protein CSA66_05365 [Pseudomonadota bacterium]